MKAAHILSVLSLTFRLGSAGYDESRRDFYSAGDYHEIERRISGHDSVQSSNEPSYCDSNPTDSRCHEIPPLSTFPLRCGANWPWLKCLDGACCSKYGWCGKTELHCAPGCQYGTCPPEVSSSSTSVSSTASSTEIATSSSESSSASSTEVSTTSSKPSSTSSEASTSSVESSSASSTEASTTSFTSTVESSSSTLTSSTSSALPPAVSCTFTTGGCVPASTAPTCGNRLNGDGTCYQSYKIKCGATYNPAFQIGDNVTSATTLRSCIAACESTAGCAAIRQKAGECYLFSISAVQEGTTSASVLYVTGEKPSCQNTTPQARRY
ncbi:hypothetical protein VTL71DRAFT_2645 [Oculimacula yallundae]|uniref:Chitin-binding type-1 domain-containing protein n=1 Tax=Oculimacula yallundae TaxID=86028 RepID=A0ABR4CBK1_9HELO